MNRVDCGTQTHLTGQGLDLLNQYAGQSEVEHRNQIATLHAAHAGELGKLQYQLQGMQKTLLQTRSDNEQHQIEIKTLRDAHAEELGELQFEYERVSRSFLKALQDNAEMTKQMEKLLKPPS